MGRFREGFFRDDTYRPQRPKVRRKSIKFVSSSAGLVDRVREMVEQCREEERGQEDREGTMVENMSVLNMMQVIVGFIL